MNGLADAEDCLNTYVNSLKVDCHLRDLIGASIDNYNSAIGPNLSHSKEHSVLYGLKVFGYLPTTFKGWIRDAQSKWLYSEWY